MSLNEGAGMERAGTLTLGWLGTTEMPGASRAETVRHAPGLHVQTGAERSQAEFFIRDVFVAAYGARLGNLMPTILAERDPDGGLLAACGLRAAAAGPLFLETYLGAPIEIAIAAHTGAGIARESIVEVGNLAVRPPFTARELIASLTRHLLAGNAEWSVFTAVGTLRNAFSRLRVPFLRLGAARLDALAPEARAAWGTYYDTAPEVLAVRVRDAAHALLSRPRQ
jgi:hypothetical protein